MKFYRDNWYRLTIIAFIFLAFYMIFWGHKTLSPIQIILTSSFMALLIHQFEEYVFPGGAPPIINIATFNEKTNFRNYPGNMQSSMFVNNLAYVVYISAIIFPELIWLGLATMFFNLFQFIGHGLQMNKALKTWYNPGLASVVFLFIPISIYYMVFITENNLTTTWDWVLGAIAFVVTLIVTTILPVQLLKDKNSPYVVPEWQIEQFNKVKNFASLSKK